MTSQVSLQSRFTFRSGGRFIRRGNEVTATSLTRDIRASKLGDLDRLGISLNSVSIGVGYPNSGIHTSSRLSYAFLASILEFGTRDGRIPARPYLRLSGEIVSQQISADTSTVLRSIANSNTRVSNASVRRSLQPLADRIAARTRRIMFSRLASVADNAPSTIRKKGFDRPWIRTGELVSRLEGVVR